MKRMINASAAYNDAERKAKKIYQLMSTLFDELDDAPEEFVDNNDLGQLYEELEDTLPALQIAINSKGLEF